MQRAFNSKKRTELIISSLPVLQSGALLIAYLPVNEPNTDNKEDDNNDDEPFQDIDEINSSTDNDN